VTETQLS